MNKEQLQLVVLDILQDWWSEGEMYWDGYQDLIDEINYRTGKLLTEEQVRGLLYSLKDAGMVETKPIFRMGDGMLNGKGWFYKKNNTIEQLKNIGEEKWKKPTKEILNRLKGIAISSAILFTSKESGSHSPTEE